LFLIRHAIVDAGSALCRGGQNGSIRKIRKGAFDAEDAFVACLGQGDALRFQIADGDAEVGPHGRFDDADDLVADLPRGVNGALEVMEEIFRIAQRRDLDDVDALSFIKALGNKLCIFKGVKMDAPVVKRFVEVLQVLVQKAARRRLQCKDTHNISLKRSSI
jgi:hypothetical protein